MTHSDDTGLVLPPRAAPVQVVIVPICGKKASASEKSDLMKTCEGLLNDLTLPRGNNEGELRVALDRDIDSPPGSRFYTWERRGVPLRLEVGARDIKAGKATVALRTKAYIPLDKEQEGIAVPIGSSDGGAQIAVRALLRSFHNKLYNRALERTNSLIVRSLSYTDMKANAIESAGERSGGEANNDDDDNDDDSVNVKEAQTSSTSTSQRKTSAGVSEYKPVARAFLVPWANDADAEAAVKLETKFTLRCYPYAYQNELTSEARCFYSGKKATHMALFARAY
jgi:prolyl-tRNA synthetase